MSEHLTPFEALQLVVERAGSQSAFARICRVAQPTVWKWLRSTKRLPAEHVLTAEAATGVSRHDLRPDIYPRGRQLLGRISRASRGRSARSFTGEGMENVDRV